MESILTDKQNLLNIRTPDQRLRVFVSSTIKELASEREEVRKTIEQLHLIPVLFELGARPHPPRELYRAYLSQSHIFIGIYWQSYGWVASDMAISGLEDEYLLSENMPRLIYIKNPAPDREQGLMEMLNRIKNEGNVSFKYFSTPQELGELIADDLVLMLSERFEISLIEKHLSDHQVVNLQTNLPHELSLFIGREKQIAELSGLLEAEDTRLITLTGPGGVGKTRLAIKVASNLLGYFKDGVWLVELASLSDPALVVQHIADTFAIHEAGKHLLIQSLLDYLSDKDMLLIIDNCEHLVESISTVVGTILRGAPQVKILATSRELLSIPGEKVWSLPTLSTPDIRETIDLERLTEYESVNLFVDRTKAVKPDFALTIHNAAAIAKICTQLDGIPLAIELAAARVRMLSVEQISSRLDDRFRLLVGNRTALPRQQTLRALIDWSYELLSKKERALFRRLSVFAGSWTLSAAEQVCSGRGIEEGEVLELLAQLIDKSLVNVEGQEIHKRFRFLDTINQFSRQRLSESEEIEEYIRKHFEYFLSIAEEAYGELWGSNQDYWLRILGFEHDNIRFALESLSFLTGQEELMLRMAGSLWRFWEIRGYISEGREWLGRALEMNPDAPAYLQANGLRGAGHLACQQGDYEKAREMHEKSLALFTEIEFKPGIARQLEVLGEIAWYQGDYPRALAQHTESLALRYEIKDKEGIAASLGHIGNIARDRGNYSYARELLEEALALNRELGDKLNIALSLNNLGLVAHLECEYTQANILFEEAVSIYRQLDDRVALSHALQNLGDLAKDQGNFLKAKSLYDECLAMNQESGDKTGIAQNVSHLAEIAFFQGRYYDASDLAQQSLSDFRKLGIKRGISRSLQILAYTAHYQGDYERAISLANESLNLATEIDSPRAIAYAKGLFGLVGLARGDFKAAMENFQETLSIFQKVNDRRNIAHTLINLARTAYRQGDSNRAVDYLKESQSISFDLNIQWSLSFSLEIMGLLQRNAGNYEQAFELFHESLRISVEQANQQGVANCLAALAGLAAITDQPERAACLFSAAQRLRQEMGAVMGNDDQKEYEYFFDILRDQLDEVALEAALAEGFLKTNECVIEGLHAWLEKPQIESSQVNLNH